MAVLATTAMLLAFGAARSQAMPLGQAEAPLAESPHTGTDTTCDPQTGTGGLDTQQLCWLDWSHFDLSEADTSSGQKVSWTLLNGDTMTATVQDTTAPNATPSTDVPGASGLYASPQLSGFAWFGETEYQGITGDPVLYQENHDFTDTVTLSNIAVTNASGAPVDNYQLVSADAEETGSGESIEFSTNSALASTGGPAEEILSEPSDPTADYCTGGISGDDTSTVTCTGGSTFSGAMVVMAEAPTTAVVKIVGNGQEGFALGVIEAPAQPSGDDVYQENFSNGLTTAPESIGANALVYSGGAPSNVTGTTSDVPSAYTGGAAADDETYTADKYWSPAGGACNGVVLDSTTSIPTSTCSTNSLNFLTAFATGLGEFQGDDSATAATSGALGEATQDNEDGEQGGCATATPVGEQSATAPGTGDSCIEFATAPSEIPVTNGHFYEATADYAVNDYAASQASGCDAGNSSGADPSIGLALTDPANGSNDLTLGSGLDPCAAAGSVVYAVPDGTGASADVLIAQLQSAAGIWKGGSSAGLVQTNADEGGDGNDGATTDIQVMDVTPTLSEALSPATLTTGQPATLTYTVTNTAELAAKDGFSFNDTLPSGLKVVSGSTPTTTCNDATNSQTGTVTASGSSVAIGGSLAAGASTCTVTVQVTAASPGTYTDAPSDLGSVSGLIAPTGSGPSVTFQDASLSATVTVSPSPVVPGGPMTVLVDLTNHGPASAAGATATYTVPAGVTVGTLPTGCTQSGSTITCAAGTLTDGESKSFTIPTTVSPSATGTLVNAVALATTTPQNGATSATGSGTSVALSPESALTVTDTASATSVTPGQTVTYAVKTANAGPSDATNYTVTDAFGPGVEVTADTIPGGTCTISGTPSTGETVTCTVADLPAGQSVTADITAEPLTDTASLANTVSAKAADASAGASPAGGAPAVATASVTGATDSLTTSTSGDQATATATATDPNDPGATPVSYSWSWGDGTAADTTTTDSDSHAYAKPGTYTLTSTVTYSDGTVVTTTQNITIAATSTGTGTTTSGTGSKGCTRSQLYTHITHKHMTTKGLKLSGYSVGNCHDKLKKVQIAIARINHKEQCSFLSAKGTFGPYGSCKPQHDFIAKGTYKWSFRLKFAFAPAHYWIWENVVDTAGKASRNTAKKHVTFHLH
jgi:fimbrial isopeptide formation D2 family protein/uncharacterized repeat protein (TIGR01451 family)